MNNKPIRHGEVLLIPRSTSLPKGKRTKVTSYIVGHSETGHHHVLESKTSYNVMRDTFNRVWLELEAEASLVHQKTHDTHSTLTVAPGVYEVAYKNEYNPWTRVIGRVQD